MEYDVKKALKEAKEQVKNRDYNSALETCKIILKHDKNSYLAWVLSAAAFQELGQIDKALAAFNKATQLHPDQLPAWQGLASALEHERTKTVLSTDNGTYIKDTCTKLASVYAKLEELLSSDPVKVTVLQKKQCELFAFSGDINSCLDKARSLLQQNDMEITTFTLKVLLPYTSKFDVTTLEMVEKILSNVLSGDCLEAIFFQEYYLNILLQLGDDNKCFSTALNILQLDSNNLQALQTICKSYTNSCNPEISSERMKEIIENLLILQPNNVDALTAKARWYLLNHQPHQAKSLIENVKHRTGKSLNLEILLSESHEQLCSWCSVEVTCRSILDFENLKDANYWKLKLAKSLLQQGTEEQLKEAGTILATGSFDRCSSSFQVLQALHLLRTNQAVESKLPIDHLESSKTHKKEITLLKFEYLIKTELLDDALSFLDSISQEYLGDPSFNLECAKLLWPSRKTRAKSVVLFLNVIKINREIAEPYVYLGTFYGQQTESEASLQRAARCLEKAFQLQPNNQDVSQKLFDAYIALNDNTNAQKLLDVVIKSSQKGCRWAWLKKGYLHLRRFRHETQIIEREKEAGRAVTCFQNALDMDLKDSFTYENLGEAYIARGSYTAALKAFQRALELNPNSIYATYQAASVKQILGEFTVAAEEFEALVEREPNYLPALKGLADTLLCQADEYLVDGFTGRVVDCYSRAIGVLVKAAQQAPHYACLWSLLGRISLMLWAIPEKDFSTLRLPVHLLQELQEESVSKLHVMKLGVKFFLSALHLTPNCASLWHNLGLSYYNCFLIDNSDSNKSYAVAAVKKAITYEPNEPSHWDLLGLASDQPAVKQHAFIRAIELNPNTLRASKSWTNLGALYLQYDNAMLAHECFKRAQNLDPFYVAAWVGQGHVADLLSPSEAMDLYRHSISIGSGNPGQCEGAPAYAHWVITMLSDVKSKSLPSYRYSIVQMHAVTTAIDGLVKYVALYPEDGCALNLLGLLYERQGLLSKAEEAFVQGIEYVSRDVTQTNIARIDKLKANLARLYTTCGRCEEATELYGTLQESELSSACGIALAHFKANRHAEAYITYEAALHWLASDEENKSHLLVAMAMAAFRRDFPDPEVAKDLLLQSSELKPASVYGLLALCALGLLTNYETLTSAAIQELLPYQTEPRYVADITTLLAFKELYSGNEVQGRREIMRNLHLLPNVTDLWALLTSYMVNVACAAERPHWNDGLLVARSAESTVFARRENESSTYLVFKPMDLSQIISLNSVGYLLAGQGSNSLIAAQKAVHSNPHSAASWSALLAAAVPYWATPAADDKLSRLGWLKKLIEHLRRHCDVTSYSRLAPWLGNYERRLISMLSQ